VSSDRYLPVPRKSDVSKMPDLELYSLARRSLQQVSRTDLAKGRHEEVGPLTKIPYKIRCEARQINFLPSVRAFFERVVTVVQLEDEQPLGQLRRTRPVIPEHTGPSALVIFLK
jgi:hypothetical protein